MIGKPDIPFRVQTLPTLLNGSYPVVIPSFAAHQGAGRVEPSHLLLPLKLLKILKSGGKGSSTPTINNIIPHAVVLLHDCQKKMILFNDLETTEKVKVYDTQFKAEKIPKQREILTDYRVGDVYVPKVSREEGLSLVADDFLNAILTNSKPISNYELGLQVVKILEAAQKSIKNDGIMISI